MGSKRRTIIGKLRAYRKRPSKPLVAIHRQRAVAPRARLGFREAKRCAKRSMPPAFVVSNSCTHIGREHGRRATAAFHDCRPLSLLLCFSASEGAFHAGGKPPSVKVFFCVGAVLLALTSRRADVDLVALAVPMKLTNRRMTARRNRVSWPYLREESVTRSRAQRLGLSDSRPMSKLRHAEHAARAQRGCAEVAPRIR